MNCPTVKSEKLCVTTLDVVEDHGHRSFGPGEGSEYDEKFVCVKSCWLVGYCWLGGGGRRTVRGSYRCPFGDSTLFVARGESRAASYPLRWPVIGPVDSRFGLSRLRVRPGLPGRSPSGPTGVLGVPRVSGARVGSWGPVASPAGKEEPAGEWERTRSGPRDEGMASVGPGRGVATSRGPGRGAWTRKEPRSRPAWGVGAGAVGAAGAGGVDVGAAGRVDGGAGAGGAGAEKGRQEVRGPLVARGPGPGVLGAWGRSGAAARGRPCRGRGGGRGSGEGPKPPGAPGRGVWTSRESGPESRAGRGGAGQPARRVAARGAAASGPASGTAPGVTDGGEGVPGPSPGRRRRGSEPPAPVRLGPAPARSASTSRPSAPSPRPRVGVILGRRGPGLAARRVG